MKFSIKNYWLPTPRAIRKISDFILGLTTVLIAFVVTLDDDIISDQHAKITISILAFFGVVTKYTSNFFKDENVVAPKETDNV